MIKFYKILILVSFCIYLTFSSAVDRCFCKLQESVDDCSCSITQLESFNNEKIFPILSSLLTKDFFRYFKVRLNKECPFWIDDSRCALKDCHVKGCTSKEIPKGLQERDSQNVDQQLKYAGTPEFLHHPECVDENHGGLGNLDTSLSADQKEAMVNWTRHDDLQDNFCQLDDEDSGATFVDLIKNPERYTGYKGKSAHRIWNSIYKENCFNDYKDNFGMHLNSAGLNRCLEKRIFYRLISGLHTSISIHLSRHYLLEDKRQMSFGVAQWGPNHSEFMRRFDPAHELDGPQRLKNLFFTYLVEMRAISKLSDYLVGWSFYTGDLDSDADTRVAIRQLVDHTRQFPDPFDESRLFQGDSLETKQLKLEFKAHFRNISRIMDCVGCDKCKLWGKLQTSGMGTALKILFNYPATDTAFLTPSKLHLTRTEIVSLFNAFGRLSTSIQSLSIFRNMMRDEL